MEFGGGNASSSGISTGDQFNLSWLSCSVEISLFSSFWVVMRIHSVILEIFLEV